jgi:Ca-activated chloride channel homolog
MIQFAWPWAFLLLPLPYLVYRFAPPALAAEEAALWVPQLEHFGVARHQQGRSRPRWALFFALLCWLLLVIACARPQWLGDPLEMPISGRDLIMAVDLSGSMQTEDFELRGRQVDRLTALKSVAEPFIEQRVGDRIGLILFGEQAYVQVPLSFDRATVRQLLDEAAIGLAGRDYTAIGDAIGLALKRATGGEARQQVLILLTDGANNAGTLTPLKAAELAARKGLKIYTIGIGAEEMEVKSFFFSRTVNPSRDLDEKSLKTIAETTGGRYFRARDSAELDKIYGLLDQLEPVEREQDVYRPVSALFPWPLGAALVGAVLLVLVLRELLPSLRSRK